MKLLQTLTVFVITVVTGGFACRYVSACWCAHVCVRWCMRKCVCVSSEADVRHID